jgi:hypothetical protein
MPMRVPVSMPVPDARAALSRAGEVIALVTNRGVEIGVVTAGELEADRCGPTGSIADLMTREIVRTEPTRDLTRTLRAYREAAWSSAIRRGPGARADEPGPWSDSPRSER